MKQFSLVTTLFLALAATAGCAVDEPTGDPDDLGDLADPADEPAAKPGGGGGGGGGLTCDDFDSYCDASHPCDEGFVCAFDANNCGSNFFGTYPNCGVTATCYPACQPKE